MVLNIATFNAHKAKEYEAIVKKSGLPFEVRCLKDCANASSPEETGKTLLENAIIKARYSAAITCQLSLGDDTGLEVSVLGGAPGIYSARYAGEECDPVKNSELLLRNMSGFSGNDRNARFVCAIALAYPDGNVETVVGSVSGRITEDHRGTGGFGYDSLFLPDGYDQTYAEMSSDKKNAISHRAKAMRLLIPLLEKFR